MRPEDLKAPFKRTERRILIQDRIWFIPQRCGGEEDFIFPGWDHPDVFGNTNPIKVEYCSGNGAWIAEKAASSPETNWVAIEKKFLRVRKIWSKVKNLKLNNLFIICGEAFNATMRYFPERSVSEIYINFPDPWPKKKHVKNRLIHPSFVSEMARILEPHGAMTFVTDDEMYSEWTIEHMKAEGQFESCYPEPYFVTEHHDYGTSYFDRLWRDKGKTIRYHQFKTA